MGTGGNVSITVVDGGQASIIVPGASTQLVIGTSSTGTVGQIIATRSPSTLSTNLGVGPLPEAAGLSCLAGGTVLAIRATTATAGTSTAVTKTGTGTSVITVTGTPVDTYYVQVNTVLGGTIGTGPITLQISLDAGRNFGPLISLGTATTLAIGSTGVTLNFGAGTTVTGDVNTFGTIEPLWNTAGIQAALNAFQSSQYALQGVGSIHIVGSQGGVASGASATTIQGYLDTLATGFSYDRSFFSARDASPASKWGGTGESESTWISSLQTDYAAVAARRLCVGGAYWNMPSAFPNPASTGASAYRRPIAYAAAARQCALSSPQRHLGRVKDGSLTQVVVNASSDPLDGFVYHDERINPGLDYIIAGSGGRFMSTMTRTGLPGVFISNPLSMAPLGSDFFLMPLGSVMDVFSTIMHTQGQIFIDDDVRLNTNGTIYENDARGIETALASAVNSVMFAQKMISQKCQPGGNPQTGGAVTVDRTTNVKATNNVVVYGTIVSRGYVLSMTMTLQFQNPNAAA